MVVLGIRLIVRGVIWGWGGGFVARIKITAVFFANLLRKVVQHGHNKLRFVIVSIRKLAFRLLALFGWDKSYCVKFFDERFPWLCIHTVLQVVLIEQIIRYLRYHRVTLHKEYLVIYIAYSVLGPEQYAIELSLHQSHKEWQVGHHHLLPNSTFFDNFLLLQLFLLEVKWYDGRELKGIAHSDKFAGVKSGNREETLWFHHLRALIQYHDLKFHPF